MSKQFHLRAQARSTNHRTLGARVGFMTMVLVVMISLMGMNPQSASAAGTYYVDNTVACSDSGPGSSGNPFCTIAKAASVAVVPGDTVYVKHGTYAETVYPATGTAGSPITFKADPGVTVTGDRTGFGAGFAISTKSYIVIDGFTVTGTTIQGIYVDSSNNITIKNNTVTYTGLNMGPTSHAEGIYLKNTSNSTVTGNVAHHNSCIGIRLHNGSTNNTVSKNVSYANSSAIADPAVIISDAAGIELSGSSNNTVINNITYGNEDSGINIYVSGADVPSTYNFVIGNLSYGNGDHGIDHNNSPYNTVVGNTVHGNGTTGINFEGSTGSHHATVVNNISTGNGFNPPDGSFGGNLRVDAASVLGTTLDYNLYYRQSASVQIIWNDSSYTSRSAFRAVEPTQEVNGLEGNPQFVTPVASVLRVSGVAYAGSEAVGDYHLQSTSPGIDNANSGAPNQPDTDIEGKMRADIATVTNNGAGPRLYDDRGAYEYQPVGATATSTTVVCGGGNPVMTYGSSISCIATVVAGSGVITPTGNVNWATNGGGSFATSPCTLSGVDATATCSVTYTPTTVGTGSHLITANYVGDVNFLASSGTRTVTVNKKALTVSGVLANSKVYNGNMGAALNTTNAALVGIVTGDSVSLSGTPVGTFADKNVGTNKPVTVTGYTLAGPDAGDYTVTQPTGLTANITKAPLTVTAENKEKKVGKPDPAFTFVYSGFVGTDTSTEIDTAPTCGVSVPHTAVGSYTIVCSGGVDNNYSFTYSNGTLTVSDYVATFQDVPLTHPFWQYVEKFYAAGITSGCSSTPMMFCPDQPVTRGQMAVFLEKALGNTAPAPSPTNMFSDVLMDDPFKPFIEEFYNDGITSGCATSPLRYCPNQAVTRGQMAVFIEKALGNNAPNPNPTDMFSDVALDAFKPFIEEFYNDGITSGCATNPLRYCPNYVVTRGQMAVFIAKAFNLPMP